MTSLFKIDFNGTVTKLWALSLAKSDTLNILNLFAVDAESKLVYLGSRDQFLAVDLMTGAVKIKIHLVSPNIQYFWSYDYVAREKAIYGLCCGKPKVTPQWDWCRIMRTGSNTAHIDYFFEIPYTNAISPTNDIYYMDSEEQTIWYYPFKFNGLDEFAVGINYTTGKEVFRSAANPNDTEDVCIVRDHELDRVFTYVINPVNSAPVGIGELFPEPQQKKILIDFSKIVGYSVNPVFYGTCAYDQSTHTMIGLMAPTGDRPTYLLFVDIITSTFKLIPLSGFQKWNNLSLTSVKFIPTI